MRNQLLTLVSILVRCGMIPAPDSSRFSTTMMLLGRLDGRLQNSPATDIFLARARLDGAAALAGLAGVPIDVRSLQEWIAGRCPPPRASEGLNDPISVSAVFHFALSRDEDTRDPVLQATLNMLRSVLDDRVEVEKYGREDLAHFGPLWRTLREIADMPYPRPDLMTIAHRVIELMRVTHEAPGDGPQVLALDGRSLDLPPRPRDRNWLVATALPRMLHRAGITMQVIPSLILLPKLMPPTSADLVKMMERALRKAVDAGLRDLDRIERQAAGIQANIHATKRSRAPLLSRLQIAYPGLQPKAVARLLDVSPQGARKLLAAIEHQRRSTST
ncbi:hypothetical protein [Sphingobium sp. CECT 9361]|uniref:hypothetical protein n=1 Tax=Sphingobium sp. CECT 9361 TaxID=2845384 RepID=UPI001E4FAF4E|nr:hypothetical protein [Sphingobium sp. CECT 9361]